MIVVSAHSACGQCTQCMDFKISFEVNLLFKLSLACIMVMALGGNRDKDEEKE